MRISTVSIAIFIATFALLATDAMAKDEVYRWVDKDGVVHFGDRPAGQTNAEKIDVQTDSGKATSSVPATANPDQQQEPQTSYAQQRRDERAEVRKATAEKDKDLAAGCAHHKQLVSQLEPSTRVMVEYEDGTVIRMDDNDRLKKLAESKAYIAENCNK